MDDDAFRFGTLNQWVKGWLRVSRFLSASMVVFLRFDSDFRFRAVAWLADPVPSFFPHSNREGFGGVRDGESPNLIFIESGFAEVGQQLREDGSRFFRAKKIHDRMLVRQRDSQLFGRNRPEHGHDFPVKLVCAQGAVHVCEGDGTCERARGAQKCSARDGVWI